jgi:hypothetical protein
MGNTISIQVLYEEGENWEFVFYKDNGKQRMFIF